MTTKIYNENGQLVEIQENGQTVWSKKQELKDVAEAAARGAIEKASGVSGDKQKAADAARKAVEEMI